LEIANRFAIMGINPLEYLRACLTHCEALHHDDFAKQFVLLNEKVRLFLSFCRLGLLSFYRLGLLSFCSAFFYVS
jgi:hypothetical protein